MAGVTSPPMCTTTSPAVSGPMARSTSFGSTAIVAGSQSTNLGRAPAATTAAAVAKNVFGRHQHLAALDGPSEGGHGPQRDLDRARPRVDRHRVLGAVVGGEAFLELAADRAERELPGGQRLVDASEDLGAVLSREVDLRWGHGQSGRGRAGRGAGSGHRVLRL